MLGELVRRGVNLLVLGLAALAFFTVPLGEKTLYQHCAAIFTTREAKALGDGVERAGRHVEHEVRGDGKHP